MLVLAVSAAVFAQRGRPETASFDIIIKGGSVEIQFNEQTFSGKGGKYSNEDKTIASVEVTDHNSNQTQRVNIPVDGKCTIRITTK